MDTTNHPAQAGGENVAVPILYTNYRGETGVRRVVMATHDDMPRVWFGKTKWHPEGGFLFEAWDTGKRALRVFAFSGIKAWGQEAVDATLASAREQAPAGGVFPQEPTDAMEAAFEAAYWAKSGDISSPTPTEHPKDGGGPFGYGYRAMIAAAPPPVPASREAGEVLSPDTLRKLRSIAKHKHQFATIYSRECTAILTALAATSKPEPGGGDWQPKIETCPKCNAQGVAFICDQSGCPVNGGAAYPWTKAAPTPTGRPLTAADQGELEDLRRLSEAAEEAGDDYFLYDRGSFYAAETTKAAFDGAAVEYVRRLLASPASTPALAGGETEQGWSGIEQDEARIAAWVTDRFGPVSLNNPMERADRLLEEAIEMQQAVYHAEGMESDGERKAVRLAHHVYCKEPGDPRQEMGGVMTCALALGRRLGVRLDRAAQAELTRIEGLSKAYFDKRHQAKVDAGVAAQHDRGTPPVPDAPGGPDARGEA